VIVTGVEPSATFSTGAISFSAPANTAVRAKKTVNNTNRDFFMFSSSSGSFL
jgi:hypothetical protein